MNPKHLVAVVLTLLLAACSSSPEDQVKSLYRAIEKADDDQALKIVHPASLQILGEQKLRAYFSSMRSKMKRCGGIKEIEVKLLPGTDEHKSGTFTLSFAGDCKAEVGRLQMSKVEGAWRIGL